MAHRTIRGFDPKAFLAQSGVGRTIVECSKKGTIFSQGNPADAVFYIQTGRVKLTIVSQHGKEATIALLPAGNFLGEGCLAGQPLRIETATAVTDCTLLRIDKHEMMRVLHDQPSFSALFVAYLLSRNVRYEDDLADQLFNSTERRLARTLLLLTQFGKEGKSETVVPKISQETLAQMVGTSRERVSHFMNKFRKLGFIEYNGGLEVHSSLIQMVLHE